MGPATSSSLAQASHWFVCGQEVVRLWLDHYGPEGVAGLDDALRSGRPPKDPLAGPITDTHAGQSPACSGHVQNCGAVALLSPLLATCLGLVLSCARLQRYRHLLYRAGRTPTPASPCCACLPNAAHDENPVARVWGLTKDAVAANRLAASMEDLVRAATRFFTEMTTEQPVFLPVAA
jgi:hypothetical protein